MLRLKEVNIEFLNAGGGPEVMKRVACGKLDGFTHSDNIKNYIKCGYFGR